MTTWVSCARGPEGVEFQFTSESSSKVCNFFSSRNHPPPAWIVISSGARKGYAHTRMRFSCHLIAGGRFYPAGVEIPESVAVPGGAMRYVIPAENNMFTLEGSPGCVSSLQKPLTGIVVPVKPPRTVYV